MLALAALAVVSCLSPMSSVQAQDRDPPSAPIDFSLEETSGQSRTMAAVRGRVVILYYEDRAHTDLNRDFKEMLYRFIQDNHLQEQTTTYAVANVGSIGSGVIRDMARTAIRAIANQYGIQILLDWDRVLQAAPISMRDGDANLALIDRQGRIRWHHVGRIDEPVRRSFFRVYRMLLRETGSSGPPTGAAP